MGYLFLFLALLFGLIKVYCGKKTSYVANCSMNAIIINTVRMVISFFIGIAIALISGTETFFFEQPEAVLIAFMSGACMACFTVSWLLSVNNSAYMLVEVFVMGGVFVPLILCRLFYGEPVSILQGIAGILLIISVYFMCSYDKIEKGKMTFKNFWLLILCAISSGMSDFSQKVYVKEFENISIILFNIYTYLFAAIILIGIYVIFKLKEKNKQESSYVIVKPVFYYVLIMAGCLFLNSYFKTLSSKHLDAVLLYPLNQGLAVVFSFVMSVVLFKEKMNYKGTAGIIIALVSVIIINFC